MIVVDTSAVLEALVASSPMPALTERLREDSDWAAPHLIDVEFLHVLRRLVASDQVSLHRAEDALDDFRDLAMTRYPHHPLAERIWELRHNMTAYDAAFVSLGEALGVTLVTIDARLAATPGHHARIEIFPIAE
jgi:predicted nucleic acid-binding protein